MSGDPVQSELIYLSSLFNQKVFSKSLNFLDDIYWSSEIAKTISKDKQFYNLSEALIKQELFEILTPGELEAFVSLIRENRDITSGDELQKLSENLFKFYVTKQLTYYINKYSNNPIKLLEQLKDIPTVLTSGVDINVLGSLTASEVIEEDIGDLSNVLRSNFELINNSTPFGGYLPGSVVMFLAAPGNGKSALMLYEAARATIESKKVLWIALGDLTRYDFITRYTAVLSETSYPEVSINPDKYFVDDIKAAALNMDLITIPANVLSSEEILEITKLKDYDLVVVDYDSNVKSSGSDNMYETGGEVYNVLTEIARPTDGRKHKVVFVASQPKVHLWEELEIPLSGAGESSRKQHIIDMMITLGTANVEKPCGMMLIAKNRRGKSGVSSGYEMLDNGRFNQITASQLSMLRQYKS